MGQKFEVVAAVGTFSPAQPLQGVVPAFKMLGQKVVEFAQKPLDDFLRGANGQGFVQLVQEVNDGPVRQIGGTVAHLEFLLPL